MKPNLILLPQLLPIIHKVSRDSYLSKTMAECTQNQLIYNIRISQRSRCGENFNNSFIANCSKIWTKVYWQVVHITSRSASNIAKLRERHAT